jgi:ParB/RepB/Spo0J family partition protein
MTAIPDKLRELGIQPGDGEKKQVEFTLLDLAKISPSDNNPRSLFEQAEIEELAASIAAKGLLQPITVRKRKARKEAYEIIAGERRFRAVSLLGWRQVAACIRECEDDAEFLEMALIENLKRSDLKPMEKARGFAKLRESGREVGQIARTLAMSQPAVSNLLRLTQLLPDVQTMIDEGSLSQSHGIALASLVDLHDDQRRLAQGASDNNWTSKHLETVVAAIRSEHERKLNPPLVTEEVEAPKAPEVEPPAATDQAEELSQMAQSPVPAPQSSDLPKPPTALASPKIAAPESVPANPPAPPAPSAASAPTPPKPVAAAPTPVAPAPPVAPPPPAGLPGFVTLSIREELNAQLMDRRILAKTAISMGLLVRDTIGQEGMDVLTQVHELHKGIPATLENLKNALIGTIKMFLEIEAEATISEPSEAAETTPAIEATEEATEATEETK